VLALSGLDPGGGAGLLADARAIGATGAFACAVATLLTTQSTRGLRRVALVSPKLWIEQARRVLEDQDVRAIKTGALGSAANVRAAASLLARYPRVPVVVDPVLVPTRGRARLLDRRALGAMRRELIPRATLVTANVAEAEALTGERVSNLEEARVAAKALVTMGARAALVKGGHLKGTHAIDVLVVGEKLTKLDAPRLRLKRKIHGAGCVLASLIAGRLARGDALLAAVRWAKRAHHRALSHAVFVGGDLAVLVDA
jgi:hydroxymethylpyrimidine/phosphomethylpyrimidine kinase